MWRRALARARWRISSSQSRRKFRSSSSTWSDEIWAVRRAGGSRPPVSIASLARTRPLILQPSTATTIAARLRDDLTVLSGRAGVSAAIDDELVRTALGRRNRARRRCSTINTHARRPDLRARDGAGPDRRRFAAAGQPLVAVRGTSLGHCCHPYDLCTKLIAEEAGVVVTDPRRPPMTAPLDTESNVAWIGYANRALHHRIAPVLIELLREHGAVAD